MGTTKRQARPVRSDFRRWIDEGPRRCAGCSGRRDVEGGCCRRCGYVVALEGWPADVVDRDRLSRSGRDARDAAIRSFGRTRAFSEPADADERVCPDGFGRAVAVPRAPGAFDRWAAAHAATERVAGIFAHYERGLRP